MARDVTTHLMFEGAALEAMTLYVSLFGNSHINRIEWYGAGELGAEGTVSWRASHSMAAGIPLHR